MACDLNNHDLIHYNILMVLMHMAPKKWWHFLILFILVGSLTLTAMAALAVTLIYPTLPSLEALTDYKPKLPLRVYSADGFLISGHYG